MSSEPEEPLSLIIPIGRAIVLGNLTGASLTLMVELEVATMGEMTFGSVMGSALAMLNHKKIKE